MLQARHLQHLIFYGTNTKRMDSQCIANFSSGVENREASIRIPFRVSAKSFGFYEDRRPASNMDPYLVTMMLVSTTHGIPLPMKVGQLHSGHWLAALDCEESSFLCFFPALNYSLC